MKKRQMKKLILLIQRKKTNENDLKKSVDK